MLALRRVPRRCYASILTRGNATISTPLPDAPHTPPIPLSESTPPTQTTSAALSPNSTRPTDTQTEAEAQSDEIKKPTRKYHTRRPRITLENPREWSRPIGVGVLPAYDEALEYIKRDAVARTRELEGYRADLAKAESAQVVDAVEVQRLREKVQILDVQSEINLPTIRWKARNGMADMSKAVYRHLVEQRWREDGPLDLLMERIYQMNVVPDLLPTLRPSIDLRITYSEKPPQSVYLRTRVKRKYKPVEPGIYMLPEQTRKAPSLYTSVFHTDTRLYTLLMVDLDVPNPEDASYQTYLHWMQPNIPLSATGPSEIKLPGTHTPYVPPHPQRGTPYHRYVLLLLPQQSPTEPIKVPTLLAEERLGWDFRAFAQRYGFDGSQGGGAHMFREVWDETVSHIYEHALKMEEPKFGREPKPDPYAEVKRAKKYFLA